jgi:hypothetical protein
VNAGPVLVGNEWRDIWLYLVALLAGGAIVILMHWYLYGPYVVVDVKTVEVAQPEDAERPSTQRRLPGRLLEPGRFSGLTAYSGLRVSLLPWCRSVADCVFYVGFEDFA